ncbi:MAG: sugar ABC transporter substrate-binding protein [Acidisphaera sp.]|nr:sugar ABC transporter substrate-binding protein [Acidisphaera sp.]
MKRTSLALATTLALAASASAPARAETTITFMGWVNMFDFQKPGWSRIMENWSKAHPDIKINYIGTPAEDTLRQATAAILAKRPPDIFQVSASWVQQLDDQGALEPLGPLLGRDEIGRLWKTGVAALTIDGNVQGVPWLPAPTMWVYNRNLFQRAGLDPNRPPTTWTEFVADVDKLCALPADANGKAFAVALRSSRDVIAMGSLPMFVWGFGGNTTDAGGKQNWDNAGAVKAFTWYRDMIQKGCSPDAADTQVVRSLFAQGRAGFELDGPYIKGLVATMSGGKLQFGQDKDAWVVPPLVGMDGKTRMYGGANVLAISNASKSKKEAAMFVRFLLDDPDSVNYFYQTSNQITTSNIDVINAGPMGKDVYLKNFIDAWNNVDLLPIKSPRVDAILDQVGLSLQKVIHGADVATELKALSRNMQDVDR